MNPIITEVTTGATDAILGLEALACSLLIWKVRARDPVKAKLWLGVFGLLTIVSVLGAVAHGLDITPELREILWQPLFLSLGLMLGLIAVGSVHDRWGGDAGRKVLPYAIAGAFVFYAITVIADGVFLVFVAYEVVAMLFALVVYGQLAARGQPGAAIVAAGVLVTIVAAAVQQTDLSMTLIWPLDHNGIFHLIQMPAVVMLAVGIRRGLEASGTASSEGERGPVPA